MGYEQLKSWLPYLALLVPYIPLIFPKFWDWWRESAAKKYEREKLLNRVIYLQVRAVGKMTECELFLKTKTFELGGGEILIDVSEMPEKEKGEALMRLIEQDLFQSLRDIENKMTESCENLSEVEPHLAAILTQNGLHRNLRFRQIKKYFKLPFDSDVASRNLAREVERIEREMLMVSGRISHSKRRYVKKRILERARFVSKTLENWKSVKLRSANDNETEGDPIEELDEEKNAS